MARDLAEALPALKYKTHKLRLRDLEGGGLLTTGDLFYVDSVTGSSANDGSRPDKPMATVEQALALAGVRANKGDIIVVLPGHQENISAATSMVFKDAGVRVVGFGEQRAKPKFTWTATAGTIEMDTADCSIENVLFLASVSAITVGINVDAAGCTIRDCDFDYDETGDDFVIGVDPAGVARFRFIGNNFIAEETTGAADGIRLNDTDFHKIIGNFFTGTYTNAPIRSVTGVSTGVEIRDNYISNASTTAGDGCLLLATADTGIIADNFLATANTTVTDADSAIFDPGSCQCVGNMLARGTDKAGYIVPVSSLTGGGAISWRLAKIAGSAFAGATANAHGNSGGTGDPYTWFTVTGDVLIRAIWGVVNTTLTGATATLELGVTGNTAALIAQTTATNLADGDIWTSATTAVGTEATAGSGALYPINDGVDILEDTATANITAGQIDGYCIWAPAEDGAYLA